LLTAVGLRALLQTRLDAEEVTHFVRDAQRLVMAFAVVGITASAAGPAEPGFSSALGTALFATALFATARIARP
jgi:hypothetical protein